MIYAFPGTAGATIEYGSRYDNFIGGRWVPPVKGQYFDVVTPITGQPYTQVARSTAEDIELALDAAHAAADRWGRTPAADRSNVLLKIADRIEANLERLAYAETVDNGKPMRETLNADIPLSADHFRYFAGALRAQEGGIRKSGCRSHVRHSPSAATTISCSGKRCVLDWGSVLPAPGWGTRNPESSASCPK